MTPTPVRMSLADLAGAEWVEAAATAQGVFGASPARVQRLLRTARTPVDFWPRGSQRRQAALLAQVGKLLAPRASTAAGATTAGYAAAAAPASAPRAAWGPYRLAEDGRLRLVAKSEHYHAPLGHGFPGYALLDAARRLGVPNPTHNNTRGHLVRLLEERLVAATGGSRDRVINLQTGSLAAEAGLKMMLARFFRIDPAAPQPVHAGRIPVFVVLGDDDGGLGANYHGTTILAQALRGMWPELAAGLDRAGLWRIAAVKPNDRDGLERVFATRGQGDERIAGFLHELVLMNYGGIRLHPGFLARAYELCREHAAPTLCDEIQSCLWAPGLFLFREYGLDPDFVVVGKGFPGGESAASRIIFKKSYDVLPQFGALVTNGQEEISALAYLVTMHWALANRDFITAMGDRYQQGLRALAARHPGILHRAEGDRHLGALVFRELAQAKAFAARLDTAGIDISAQTYKAQCPPVTLTKLPLICDQTVIDWLLTRMESSLTALAGSPVPQTDSAGVDRSGSTSGR